MLVLSNVITSPFSSHPDLVLACSNESQRHQLPLSTKGKCYIMQARAVMRKQYGCVTCLWLYDSFSFFRCVVIFTLKWISLLSWEKSKKNKTKHTHRRKKWAAEYWNGHLVRLLSMTRNACDYLGEWKKFESIYYVTTGYEEHVASIQLFQELIRWHPCVLLTWPITLSLMYSPSFFSAPSLDGFVSWNQQKRKHD